MDEKQIYQIIKVTLDTIFKEESFFTIDQVLEKFAFDVKLPKKVKDGITGIETWSVVNNFEKYITQDNMRKYDEKNSWLLKRQKFENLKELIEIWQKINYMTSERIYDCINVSACDPLYRCENAYRSTDCRDSKNVIFSDGCGNCNNIIACQRTGNSNFCLRVDDSSECSNSYNVICSKKIHNSFFIQDANNLHECILCSHIASQRYCIANMQFEKEEYYYLKKQIVRWILSI